MPTADPIQLVTCQVVDAAGRRQVRRGRWRTTRRSTLVLTGTLLNGNTELYNALNGKKAVIIGNGVTPADFTTPAGEAFVAGAPGVLTGMAKFTIDQFHPKTVALLANDNDAGHAGVAVIMKPIFDKAGVQVKTVFVPDEANGTAGAVGDAGRRRRQGRRVRVDLHAAELHQHVRRDQVARRHARPSSRPGCASAHR